MMLSIDEVKQKFNQPSIELPNRIREQLLHLGRGKAALVLDAAYFVGIKPNTRFTYAELWAQLEKFGMSSRMVRDTLADPIFGPVSIKASGGRGRPQRVYQLPSVETAAQSSGLGFNYKSPSDRLSPDAFKSLTAYRLELYYRLIEREPGSYSRALLSSRLGVSKRTTRTYDKLLNLKVTPKTNELEIPLNYVNIIPRERPPKGTPNYQWLETVKEGAIIRGPLIRGLAIKWLKEGRRVWKVSQTTNFYDLSDRYIRDINPDVFATQNIGLDAKMPKFNEFRGQISP